MSTLYNMFYRFNPYFYMYRSFRHFRKHSAALSFPSTLQIQTQSFCNGECPICPYSVLRAKQEQGIMTQELFEKVAHQVAEEPSMCTIWFTLQNDPLLDKRIFQWIKYFKSLNQQKRAILVTNGELINEFKLEEIIQSGLDELIISLNAHTERTFNMINKGMEYKKVIENINLLLSNVTMKSRIKISFVLTRDNEREIHEAIHYWSKKGVKTRLMYLTNRAGTLENYHYHNSTVEPRIYPWLHPWSIKRRLYVYYKKNILKRCSRAFYLMCILFNGDVILCCEDWSKRPIIGNVNHDSLRSVWNSTKFNEIRRLILEKKYKDIIPCRQCSVIS